MKVSDAEFKQAWATTGGNVDETGRMMGLSKASVYEYKKRLINNGPVVSSVPSKAPMVSGGYTDTVVKEHGVMDVDKTAQDLAAILRNGGVSETKVIEIVKAEIAKAPASRVTYDITDLNKPTVEIKDVVLPKEFDKILKLAKLRKNVLLVGPFGSGKTFIAEQVAKALGLEYGSISCTAGMSESQIMGYLAPTGPNATFQYLEVLYARMFGKGGLFCIDELDACDDNMSIAFNQGLGNGKMFVPVRVDNPIIKRHPDFVCIGAANTYGTGADRIYVGRTQLDKAFLERFLIVELPYSTKVEKANTTPEVYAWGKELRKKVERLKLRQLVSMRFLMHMSELSQTMPEYYGTEANWFDQLTTGWSSEEIQKVQSC